MKPKLARYLRTWANKLDPPRPTPTHQTSSQVVTQNDEDTPWAPIQSGGVITQQPSLMDELDDL